MFERFTENARQVVVLAQDEARTLKHNYIGTEHLLLGLARQKDTVAQGALGSLGIALEEVRIEVGRIVGEGERPAFGQIPFTPRAKKVLELSLREAVALGHNYIGPEHILLGLVREDEGVATRILLHAGAQPETIRHAVFRILGSDPPHDYEERVASGDRDSRSSVRILPAQLPWSDRFPILLTPVLPMLLGALLFGGGLLFGWLIWG
jgi:ATP-dependent Clp protease ATP-binding subunit ClpC